MTRFVIDAPTLLHLVSAPVQVDPAHQLVAPQLLRSQALDLLYGAVRRGELPEADAMAHHDAMTRVNRLQADLFVTVGPAVRTRAEGIVPVGTVEQLSVG